MVKDLTFWQGSSHYMVDLETTGLNPGVHGIREIGIVQFEYEPCRMNAIRHWRSALRISPNRFWDKGVRTWLERNPERLAAADALEVEAASHAVWWNPLGLLNDWLKQDGRTAGEENCRYFWAKPSSFDWPFFQFHYEEAGITVPFSYRRIIDLRSWMEGYNAVHPDIAITIHLPSGPHSALEDAQHQVRLLANFLYAHHDLNVSK